METFDRGRHARVEAFVICGVFAAAAGQLAYRWGLIAALAAAYVTQLVGHVVVLWLYTSGPAPGRVPYDIVAFWLQLALLCSGTGAAGALWVSTEFAAFGVIFGLLYHIVATCGLFALADWLRERAGAAAPGESAPLLKKTERMAPREFRWGYAAALVIVCANLWLQLKEGNSYIYASTALLSCLASTIAVHFVTYFCYPREEGVGLNRAMLKIYKVLFGYAYVQLTSYLADKVGNGVYLAGLVALLVWL